MDLRAAPALNELGRGFADTLLVNVIAEHDADRFVVRKVFGQNQRRRNSSIAFLIGVIQMFQAEFLAVTEKPKKIAGVVAASDDEDFGNTGVNESLDRIVDHRPVVDREQVLVGDLRQWIHPRAEAAS